MKNLTVAIALVGLLLGLSVPLLVIAVLANPAAQTGCANPAGLAGIPDAMTATTANGRPVVLNRAQLQHAHTIAATGYQTAGITQQGILIALTAAITESDLRMLANPAAHPASAAYPNDGHGADHDSLGLFQMRPSSGWGTVAELMDPTYQAQAFYGGPDGPNHRAPPGLLDLSDWQGMSVAKAAQAVEVSAHPDRYVDNEPVARTVLSALTTATPPAPVVGGRVVEPLPQDSFTITSGYGYRDDPIRPGVRRLHAGLDFAAPDGTPILAVAAGTVTHAGASADGGNRIIVRHTIDGDVVASVYRHMWDRGIRVEPGQPVAAGQHIADVGSQGRSTGPHLHLEIRPGGWPNPAVDPYRWLASHNAAPSSKPSAAAGCAVAHAPPPAPFDGVGNERLVDPTGTGGFVTARLAHLIAQTRLAFPDSGWACWSPRPGSRSEHPLGRACDITFGNPIGTMPEADQVERGWQMADWLQTHAETLQVQYLIWQGQIWSHRRAAEGWRAYDGGGMHDPTTPTGGHYDHLHVTVTGN